MMSVPTAIRVKASRAMDRVARGSAELLRASYDGRLGTLDDSDRKMVDLLRRSDPALVCRLGATELAAMRIWVRRPDAPNRAYPASVLAPLATNAGLFPATSEMADRMALLYADVLRQADAFAVWFNRGERQVIERLVPDRAALIHLSTLNPIFGSRSWLREVEGRRVLVVHPFAGTIAQQIPRLHLALPGLWPECEIIPLRAVQSIGGQPDGPYATWFDALEHMQHSVASSGADTCLVGAGAYGLPLAAYARTLGMDAVLVGGGLQLLFGIMGARWEAQPEFRNIENRYWVRPSLAERPPAAGAVEHGCYW